MHIPSQQQAPIRFMDIYRDSVREAGLQVPFDNLEHGTKVLSNKEECIRYMALYGGHHFHKIYAAYHSTKFRNINGKNIEIIDWGCGQALATGILIDYLIEKDIHPNIQSITLIDPSTVAIKRGRQLVQLLLKNDASTDSGIHLVNKYLDELDPADFVTQSDIPKIHLFSNILDVEGVDLNRLYQLMVKSFQGANRIIAISPDNGKQQRLEGFHNLFLQSHRVSRASSSSADVSGEIFYVASGRYETRTIGRYERQFTAFLI